MKNFIAVLILLVVAGCEHDSGCELTRIEASEAVCEATVIFCEKCKPNAPICETLPSDCSDISYHPDDLFSGDECVDYDSNKACFSLVGVLESVDPIIFEDPDQTLCDFTWEDVRGSADVHCAAGRAWNYP